MEIIQMEKILKALANRRRLKILQYLKEHKKVSVTEMAGHINLSFKSTSRHLAVLRNTDLVEAEQVNLSVFYSVSSATPKMIDQILSSL